MTWVNVGTTSSGVVSGNYIWDSSIGSSGLVTSAQIFTTPDFVVKVNYVEFSIQKNLPNASGGEVTARIYASTGTKGVDAKPTGDYLHESSNYYTLEEFPFGGAIVDSTGTFEALIEEGEITSIETGDKTRGFVFNFEEFNLEPNTDYWVVPYKRVLGDNGRITVNTTTNTIGDSTVDSGHITIGVDGNWNTPSATHLTTDLVYVIGYNDVGNTVWVDDTTSWVP